MCVLASHTDKAQFLYPINKIDPKSGATITQTTSEHLDTSTYSIAHAQAMYKQFRDVDEAVTKELKRNIEDAEKMAEEQQENGTHTDSKKEHKHHSQLAGALSIALTYMSKVCTISADVRMRSRILVLSVTGDLDSQYIPIMNSIFAAQSHVSWPHLF